MTRENVAFGNSETACLDWYWACEVDLNGTVATKGIVNWNFANVGLLALRKAQASQLDASKPQFTKRVNTYSLHL